MSDPLKVLFVVDDALYPTNSGGRLETLEEVLSLVENGAVVSGVVSHRLPISAHDRDMHSKLFERVAFFGRGGLAMTSLIHPFSPYQLASRRFSPKRLPGGAEAWRPDVVLAAHEWTLGVAAEIAAVFGAPLVLRSHNDEVAYMRALAESARMPRRLYFLAEAWRLRIQFPRVMRDVCAVLPLASGDALAYRNLGIPTTVVPPILTSRDSVPTVPYAASSNARIAFVGSLDAPHAVMGLRWFIEEVLPLIVTKLPQCKLVVAGRRCEANFASLLNSNPHIDYLGEVPDAAVVYDNSNVFVNPVFSGSGVNMKLGAAASRGLPIVSTTVGIRGLDHLMGAVCVADHPSTFARECVALLSDPDHAMVHSERLLAAGAFYERDKVGKAMAAELNHIARGAQPQKSPG